ncbi:MAG: hypothetical protein ACFHWX_20610 [Bacteroidota bacterium]
MILRVFYFLVLMILLGCHPDKNKLVDLYKLRFNSTDASEIFFKNIRRSYYEVEENPEAAIELYTLSGYNEIKQPKLKPTIAYNWRNDFVAIMLSISENLKDQEALLIIFENETEERKLLYNESDVKTQTSVAIQLYNGILSSDEIFLVVNRQKLRLFSNSEEKDLFRVTVFDFLRFVEIR